MARINQGILGGLSGKIANVVGGSWKGINYIRALPTSVANPRTVPQVAQRDKLSRIVILAKLLLAGFIKPLWDRFAIRQSGYNAFTSENIEKMAETDADLLNALTMSKGAMTPPSITTFTADEDGVTIAWATALPDNVSSPTDQVFAAIVGLDDQGNFFTEYAGFTTILRSGGTWALPFAAPRTGCTIGVYLSFRNSEGIRVSGNSTNVYST